MKLPLVSGEDMCKIVTQLGFVLVHRKGSHTVWRHEDGRTTTIPLHSGKKPEPTRIMSHLMPSFVSFTMPFEGMDLRNNICTPHW